MYDDVLVPTDGSETLAATLEHALPVAADNDATVHALYVVDRRIVTAADADTREDLRASLEAEGREAVATVAERAEEAGLDVRTELREGNPGKAILSYADEVGADLVVVGSHGKTAREKLTSLGSVSERVVDDATVPVLVVPDAGDRSG